MNSKKILLVDDEKDILWMLGKRLKAEGYHVVTADNGPEALRLVKTQCPDLIILDEVMPGMSGGAVAQAIRENTALKSIPVIFLTALISKKEENDRNHVVADNITFAKPVDTLQLIAQIHSLLSTEVNVI